MPCISCMVKQIKMKKFALLLIFLVCRLYAFAQTDTTWHGKKCAVVLTYDDGLNVHLSNAIPALDSVGLKGTFYVSNYFNGLQPQIPKWSKSRCQWS